MVLLMYQFCFLKNKIENEIVADKIKKLSTIILIYFNILCYNK